MRFAVGTRVGSYEILSVLGAGGMGEVYRARDPHLSRDVALKILPELFALDSDRVARFKREAQVLAALNHPHIAAIYGFEQTNGVHALALELVEGPTLADRIEQGPIPVDEALDIARQIAEALEAAHEQGIIHRDLKPANIKLRPDGTVKVLDFGLAKTVEAMTPSAGTATITSPAMTQIGVILGTAAYMSPEQAKGRPADKRSDIWSFGAVLHETLSRRRAFKGEDVADTLAAVLRQDVDWPALPADTPAPVRTLIARCLERDVKRRLRDIGEARIVLEGPIEPVTRSTGLPSLAAPRLALWRRAIPIVLSSLVVGAIVAVAVWQLKPSTPPPVARFSFVLPAGQTFPGTSLGRALAISPDGAHVVYVGSPGLQLYLKSAAQLEATPISGSERYEGVWEPAFSPDGRSVAFFARSDRTLKRMAVTGGAAVTICTLQGPGAGLSWGPGGIVFGQANIGVMRVSPDGGTPEALVRVKPGEEVYGPQLLPAGRHVLFTVATGTRRDRWDKARIVVHSLGSGESRTIIEGATDARYVSTGHLLYALDGIVYAVGFDVERLAIYGPRVPVIQGVRRSPSGINGAAQFSISDAGSLVYIPGPLSAEQQLVRADRTGGVERLKLPPGKYLTPRVSPDGKRVAFGTDDGTEETVFIYDLDDGPLRRLTDGGNNRFPIWSADGTRVVFQSDREGDGGIWWQPALGGKAERLTKAEAGTSHAPESWSPTRDLLLYAVTKDADVSLRTYALADKKDSPFGNVHSSTPTDAAFSPDGRWVAYASTTGFKQTLYVQPFPETGDKYQLLAQRSDNPHEAAWSPDGRELFFTSGPGRFASVSVTTTPVFTFGAQALVPARFTRSPPDARRRYDITRTGQFIGLTAADQPEGAAAAPHLLIVLNWQEELKQLVRTE